MNKQQSLLLRAYCITGVRLNSEERVELFKQACHQHTGGLVFVSGAPRLKLFLYLRKKRYKVPGCNMFPSLSPPPYQLVGYDSVEVIELDQFDQKKHEALYVGAGMAVLVTLPELLSESEQYLLDHSREPLVPFRWAINGHELQTISTRQGSTMLREDAKLLVGLGKKVWLDL